MSTRDRTDTGRGVTDFREDATNSTVAAQYGEEIHNRPFTVRGGKVREEAVEDGRPKRWGDVVDAFRNYIREKRKFKKKFSGGVEPVSHRFSDHYSRRMTGEIYGADREIRRDFENPKLCLVTLRGCWWGRNGQPRAPLDFLDDLLESNDNVVSTFRRNLEDFARVTVLGAHEHGYPHVHHALWVDCKDVEDLRLTLKSAVESHLHNCHVATRKRHPCDDGTIEIAEPDCDPDEVSWLAREVVSQLCGFNGVLDAPLGKQRFCALMWASEASQIRRGRTFNEYVERSQCPDKGDERGSFEGLQIEKSDGTTETIPPEELNGGNSGSHMTEADPLPDSLDPVSFSD